jgi:hypothetical protein
MLKQLFGGGKPDHPLADPKEARRLLEELPGNDPLKALEELAHWHESVSAAEGFKPEARISILIMLDDAAQPRLRKVVREYLAATRPSRFQENRLWTQIYEYWRQAGQAYAKAIDAVTNAGKAGEAAKPQLPQLVARALRSLAQQVKWLHFRYGPVDSSIWRVMNGVYAFAEARGIAHADVIVYPGSTGESTPRREFLRALMLNASSPDSLLPPEVEIAERLIAELVPGFELAAAAGGAASHWTDLAQAMAPQRIVKAPQPSPGLRYLEAGSALAGIEEMIRKVEGARQLPSNLAAAGFTDPDAALGLLRHLLLYWSPLPPERKSPRHSVKSRLSIVHGFTGVSAALDTGVSLDFDKLPGENWIVENVSAGGFGAIVPQAKGDWLKIGTLLAMQPDGGNNWVVGMIRRVSKTSRQEARVGIQTLSRAPELAQFRLHGAQETGVLLPSAGLGAGETSIALRTGIFAAGQNLESERGGRSYVYMPQGVAERGEDYDIVRFREMIREA